MADLREFDTFLEADKTAPSLARRFVAETLNGQRSGPNLPLLVSELVTNAVRHGASSRLILRLIVRGSVARVEVRQEGACDELTPGSSGGYGLTIIEALSDSWGTGEDWNGVWLEATIEAA